MEYGYKYGGISFELFVKISEKNYFYFMLNLFVVYIKVMLVEQIMDDVMIVYFNIWFMCLVNCDGVVVVVVVSGEKLKILLLEQ